jgi:predicted membrane protein
MQNRGQIIVGSFLVLFGGGLLLASILHINFWAICFPMGLILLGVFFLIARQPVIGETSASGVHFVGDIIRSGEWPVTNEEFWLFAGDVRLDMSRAQFPAGETTLYFNAFVADIDVGVPSDVAVSLSSTSFVADVELNGQRVERFLSGVQMSTPDYASAERKLRLVTTCFVGDVNVTLRQSAVEQMGAENNSTVAA